MPDRPPRARILVVEDSPDVVALLERVLGEEGYDVVSVHDGDAGLAAALRRVPDLLVVDVGLPSRDGLSVTAELRKRGIEVPVLLLTARTSVADRVTGLDAGADDYLAKPFAPEELTARVRALLRRDTMRARAAALRVGPLTLDPVGREVRLDGEPIGLTQREFALLECLMREAGRTLSRDVIAQRVWRSSDAQTEETNVVDVYVAYLRKKLEAAGAPPLVHTVRGVGYVIREPDPR